MRTRIGVLLAVLLLLAATGCGATAAREDLARAVTDTRAAVNSVVLALDLLERGRTTRAAAQVTSGDMVDQVGSVQQQLASVPADTADLRQLRSRCQQVVADALSALQDAEDVLAQSGDPTQSGQQLMEAQRDLDDLATTVGGR